MKYTTAIALLLNSTQAANTGTTGCECLDTPEDPAHVNLATDSTTHVNVKTGDETFDASGIYPVSYGFNRCDAHDAGAPPFCESVDGSPDWCKTDWCFVAKTCSLTNHPSAYFVPDDRCTTEPNYYYSYEACGSTDSFTPTGYARTRYDLACTKYADMTEEEKTSINAANVKFVNDWTINTLK